eukprot:8833265-Pyramimonas_sp.AAC.1
MACQVSMTLDLGDMPCCRLGGRIKSAPTTRHVLRKTAQEALGPVDDDSDLRLTSPGCPAQLVSLQHRG